MFRELDKEFDALHSVLDEMKESMANTIQQERTEKIQALNVTIKFLLSSCKNFQM